MEQLQKRAIRAAKSSLPMKALKPKKPIKVRKNIMLSTSSIKIGKGMAHLEHRNFSNFLEMLIVRESQRLGAPQAALLSSTR